MECNKSLHRADIERYQNDCIKYLERHQNKHFSKNAVDKNKPFQCLG